MRHDGLMAMVVAVVVVGSAVPAIAQAEEPAAEIVDGQIPKVLDLGATGCNFSPGSPVRIAFSGGGTSSREFSKRVRDDTCFTWAPPKLDPCQLGGSDLPGTRYTVTVAVEADGYSLDQLITLEPDTAPPRFLEPPFDASPKPGDKVEAGDEIRFETRSGSPSSIASSCGRACPPGRLARRAYAPSDASTFGDGVFRCGAGGGVVGRGGVGPGGRGPRGWSPSIADRCRRQWWGRVPAGVTADPP